MTGGSLILGKFNWQATGEINAPVKVRQDGTLCMYQISSTSARVSTPNTAGTAGTPYTAGDNVGGKITLLNAFNFGQSNSQAAVLESISILDRDNQKAALTIVFFSQNPTAATLNDNAAQVLSTDALNVVGTVSVLTTDYVTMEGSYALAQLRNLNIPLINGGGDNKVYAAIMTTGTPTYTAGKGLQITWGIRE